MTGSGILGVTPDDRASARIGTLAIAIIFKFIADRRQMDGRRASRMPTFSLRAEMTCQIRNAGGGDSL